MKERCRLYLWVFLLMFASCWHKDVNIVGRWRIVGADSEKFFKNRTSFTEMAYQDYGEMQYGGYDNPPGISYPTGIRVKYSVTGHTLIEGDRKYNISYFSKDSMVFESPGTPGRRLYIKKVQDY